MASLKKSMKRKPLKSKKSPKRSAKPKKSPKRSVKKSRRSPQKRKSVRRTYRLGGPCKEEKLDDNWTKDSIDTRLAILTEMFKDFSPDKAECITLLQGINTHRISEYSTWRSMYLIDDNARATYDGDVVKVGYRYVDQNNGLAKVQTRFYQRTDALLFLIMKYYRDFIPSYNSGMPGIQLSINGRIGERLSGQEFYQIFGFDHTKLIDLGKSPVPTRSQLNKFKNGTVEEDNIESKHVRGFGSDRVSHNNGVRMIYISNSVFEAFIENTSSPFVIEIFNPAISRETWDKIILFLSAYVELNDHHKAFTRENVEQFRKELVTMESYINKIHIQPKDDYYYWTIYKLSLLPSLKNYLSDIKFRIYEKDPASRLPVIVLYVNADHNLIIHEIVREIQAHFARFSAEIGSGDTPRYNMPIDNLIFLAQGNGDTKKTLAGYGLLDAYFDRDQNYGVVKISASSEPLMRRGNGGAEALPSESLEPPRISRNVSASSEPLIRRGNGGAEALPSEPRRSARNAKK